MRYINQITGQEQSTGGTIYDPHVTPNVTQKDTDNATAVGIAVFFLIIVFYFWYSIQWTRWVYRYSRNFIYAGFLFLFNIFYPLWAFGFLGHRDKPLNLLGAMTGRKPLNDGVTIQLMHDTIHTNVWVIYFLVTGTIILLTLISYISLPRFDKLKIAIKNVYERRAFRTHYGPIKSILLSPIVSFPLGYWIGKKIG